MQSAQRPRSLLSTRRRAERQRGAPLLTPGDSLWGRLSRLLPPPTLSACRFLPNRHQGAVDVVSPALLLPVSEADSTSPLPPAGPVRPCCLRFCRFRRAAHQNKRTASSMKAAMPPPMPPPIAAHGTKEQIGMQQ